MSILRDSLSLLIGVWIIAVGMIAGNYLLRTGVESMNQFIVLSILSWLLGLFFIVQGAWRIAASIGRRATPINTKGEGDA